VHESVSGALFVDAGQVAGNLDELERLSHWKLSPGGGFIVHGDKDVILSLQVAYGEDLVVVFSTDPVRAFSKREKEL